MFNILATTSRPAQRPLPPILGDVSREVIHTTEAKEEETQGVCVSKAPNKQNDPTSFNPKISSCHQAAVEKQEVQESSERSHMPSSGNGRIDAANGSHHLQRQTRLAQVGSPMEKKRTTLFRSNFIALRKERSRKRSWTAV